MISNRCARKSLVTNCNSIISKNYLRFLVDSNDEEYQIMSGWVYIHLNDNVDPLYHKDYNSLHSFIQHNIIKRKHPIHLRRLNA